MPRQSRGADCGAHIFHPRLAMPTLLDRVRYGAAAYLLDTAAGERAELVLTAWPIIRKA
jgi:hypothetical protein